jgi:hypothetical protein
VVATVALAPTLELLEEKWEQDGIQWNNNEMENTLLHTWTQQQGQCAQCHMCLAQGYRLNKTEIGSVSKHIARRLAA